MNFFSLQRGRIVSENRSDLGNEAGEFGETVNRAGINEESNIEVDSRIKADNRIVGGSQAFHGQFPFMASIKNKIGSSYSSFCGGAAIAHNYVITAAHCVKVG